MPSALTYPGVYVEEIPSGVRTIVGVPTSVTAFVGRASRGPITGPGLSVFSFDEFERNFGGLDLNYPMSFAVRDYFQNGGAQAVIVRVVSRAAPAVAASGSTPAVPARTTAAPATFTTLGVAAKSPGSWGGTAAGSNGLWVKRLTDVTSADAVRRFRVEPNTKIYDLEVVERVQVGQRTSNGTQVPIFQVARGEVIKNLVLRKDSASSRRADRVIPADPLLPSESQLLAASNGDLPTADVAVIDDLDASNRTDPPSGGPARSFTNGADGEATLSVTDYTGMATAPSVFKDRLDRVDIFNLMCLPPDAIGGSDVPGSDVPLGVLQPALLYCVDRRAMLLIDPPAAWKSTLVDNPASTLGGLGIGGPEARNAALYFPRINQANPLRDGAIEAFVPCGTVAGRIAQTDVTRGVWKAPAGVDAAVGGARGLEVELTDNENGKLNPIGINCLRTFPIYGRVIWGSRTLRGADALADDYKYVPVRRLALYIEETLFRGTKWVVQEPNGETLWAQIRANVGAFMQGLFIQGAFAGTTPAQAYFVNCDKTTNPEILINQGVVTIKVGFAPLKPAEFVVIQLTQIVGTTN
jgi:phage tail sheath protein FI